LHLKYSLYFAAIFKQAVAYDFLVLPFALFLITGVLTAAHVYYLLSWAVWGAPTHPLQFVSLLGSMLLVLAAFVALFNLRISRKLATIGLVAIWPFYAWGVFSFVKTNISKREVTLRILKWQPGPQALKVNDSFSGRVRLGQELVGRLKDIPLSGTIENHGHSVHESGKKIEVILIVQKQVEHRVELPLPDHGSIIYIQTEKGFERYPPEARTLNRTVSLEALQDDPRQTSVMVELANGSRQGSGICCWKPQESSSK
jgi:hypothetical protein